MASDEFRRWLRGLDESGSITPVRLGMTRDELETAFGTPDDKGGTSRRHKTPAIWRYDTLEFHFGPDGGLHLIYEEDSAGVVRLCIAKRTSVRP